MSKSTTDQVLSKLSFTEYVSGESICAALGLTRAAVWRVVETLRARGYGIQAVTHRGYRLTDCPDELSVGAVALYRFGPNRPLFVYNVLEGSTNTKLKGMADGLPSGAALLADTQTGGRGRQGRVFFSPPGAGLYLSVLLRPPWPGGGAAGLTMLAAVAARRCLEDEGGRGPDIKWVNDLQYDGKKVAGLLTETSVDAESGEITSAVFGIGINCHKTPFPPELDGLAISMEEAGCARVSRARLAARILDRLDEMMALDADGRAAWMQEYRQHCVTLGRTVRVRAGARILEGVAVDMDVDGALRIRDAQGREEIVRAGEVL